MNILLLSISFYVLGFISGALFLVFGTIWYGKRLLKKKIPDKMLSSYEATKDRLDKVRELTRQQLDMQNQAERPQKNSLDGKFKNGLIREIKRLEEEKGEILQSIIKDGFDPELSVMDESGTIRNMKLSELMANMGITMPSKGDTKTDSKNIRKFLVHQGGKPDNEEDDDGNNTTH